MFHKHVAEQLEIKTGERYEKIISTIWCKLSFVILKSVLMCVGGSRSHNLKTIDKFELASHLARIENYKNKYVSSCVSFHIYVGSRSTQSFPCLGTLLKIKNCSINLKDFLYIYIHWNYNHWSLFVKKKTRKKFRDKVCSIIKAKIVDEDNMQDEENLLSGN